MKILVLGKNGMLGQTVYKYLSNKYDVVGTTREDFNVLEDVLEDTINLEDYDLVVNCIGLLHNEKDINKLRAVNTEFPKLLEELSNKYNFKLIHISTDCVFSGEKGSYTVDDIPDAKEPYGITKAQGEVDLTLRTSIIGHDDFKKGIGLLNWFLEQEECNGYKETYWSGVTTLELAKVIEKCALIDLKGILQVTNGEKISKYDLLNLIKEVYSLNTIIHEDYSKANDKSLVPNYDFNIPSYKQMIKEMKDFREI